MLPTSGDDAHMQPTDAPHPDHRHSVEIRRDLLLFTKIALKIVLKKRSVTSSEDNFYSILFSSIWTIAFKQHLTE